MEYNNKRSAAHRMIKARAPPGPGQGNGQGNGQGAPSSPSGGGVAKPTDSSAPASAPTTARSTPPSTPPPETTTQQRPAPKTSSTSSFIPPAASDTSAAQETLITTSSSSSSTDSTTSTSPTTTITPLTPTAVRGQTSSFRSIVFTSLPEGSTISASATSSATASGGVKTGAIVGGIGGGIIGMAILIFLVTFFLRRWRRRFNKADRFNDDFRRSAILMDDTPSTTANTTYNPRPPTMIERRLASHNVVPSIGAAEYPVAHVQPQQQYVYGQDPYAQQGDAYYDPDGSQSEAHGAYSTDPQAQAVYDAEAYGSYVAQEQYAHSNEGHSEGGQHADVTQSEPANMAGRGARMGAHDNAYGGY